MTYEVVRTVVHSLLPLTRKGKCRYLAFIVLHGAGKTTACKSHGLTDEKFSVGQEMKSSGTILAVFIFIALIPTSVLGANPEIGGEAIYMGEDYFSTDEWGITAYSYVFDSSSSSLPESFSRFSLNPGEMLFMYLLDCDFTKTVAVNHFSVGNPSTVQINSVGWTSDVVPDGYNISGHQSPYLYGFSGLAEATVYTYTGDLTDPFSALEPGEYSLIYYIAQADGYSMVSATAEGGGTGDNGLVPGPVTPEPATLFLLCLGSLSLLRKRKPLH